MNIDEQSIREVVEQVVKNIQAEQNTQEPISWEAVGVFKDMDSAVWAAHRAHEHLMDLTLETRRKMIEALRRQALSAVEELSRMAVEETGFGRVEDKVKKNTLAVEATPGIEDLQPFSYTDDHGLTLTEKAPYGVIGAIAPSTNPTETIICNSIGMIAGGNTVVFGPHPGARRVSAYTIALLNQAMMEAGGPANVLTTVENPTIEEAQHMMSHPYVSLVVVTGGPGVVKEAMKREKKVIAAGPGNPPVVVDETADIEKAAYDIVMGASFDNNIICICEKEVLVEKTVAQQLKTEMKRHNTVELTQEQTEALTKEIIADPGSRGHEGMPNKAWVGKNASVIAENIGLSVPPETRLLVCEVDREHPLVWTEQLMPVMPIVVMDNVDEAIDFAVICEHGFRHTASMHSKNIEKLSRMAKVMNCSLFVKNGSNFNGMAYGGAGYTSYTIASPTGEGFTRARNFTRERRCALIDYFRIV
jgi:propionaldehyde dehydrogenase